MHLRNFIVPVFWLILIFVLYSMPGKDLPVGDIWDVLSLDKIAHIFIFMVNTHIWIVAIRKQVKWQKTRTRAEIIALILSICYGTVLELIQGTVFVDRTTEVFDLIANILGAFLGIVMFRIVYGSKLASK